MFKEFKEFAFKGNVVDMAVGVMIGAAFGSIVTALVNDLFMPIISMLTKGIDFNELFIPLDGNTYASLADAEAAGAACIKYGAFITAIIDFLLLTLCVFFLVKGINKLRNFRTHGEKAEEAKPEPRLCPFCKTEIPADAVRCPHCTSKLD